MSLELSRHNAHYVHLGPFRWYATWPVPGNTYWMVDEQGRRTRVDPVNRYTAVLGPFWFAWTARRAVRRDIQ